MEAKKANIKGLENKKGEEHYKSRAQAILKMLTKAKIKGNKGQGPKGQNERNTPKKQNESPKGQNKRKAQKIKIKKAKTKENEGPKA